MLLLVVSMLVISRDYKDILCGLAVVLVLGFLLLLMRNPISEGFEDNRCDVDHPCPPGLKCLNGFCAKTDPLPVIEKDPVPLLPAGGPAPYF